MPGFWSRLNRPISVGITGRLTFSFAAVAILAAAANLIAEHGVAVIRTTRTDREPNVSQLVLPRAPMPRVLTDTAPTQTQSSALNSDLLSAAINRYQRAVEDRASIDSRAAAA